MQVILLIIAIIIICYAFVYWYITIPILAIFGYMCNLAMCTPQQLRSPIRHILWWLFIILLTGAMYHRETIGIFFSKTTFEYRDWSDKILEHSLSNKEDLAPLDTTFIPQPEELYGGLQVGMSPVHAVYHLMRNEELLDDLKLDSIELSGVRRHYSDNRLYGISFIIRHDQSSVNLCHNSIQFLSNKYGAPHHTEKTDKHHIAQWKFAAKHIVIFKAHDSYHGNLFIYNPSLLQEKIDAHYIEIDREKARFQEKLRKADEKRRQQEKEHEEALRKIEQENLRLRESL